MESWFLLCSFQQTAVAGWWQAIQSVLAPLGVVVVDELLDRCYKLLVGFKLVQIIHLALQDAPEALHGTVVDASADSRHALCHLLLVQSRSKLLACILESPITVK